jgi:hypothetical protein
MLSRDLVLVHILYSDFLIFLVNYLTPGKNGLEGKANPLHLIIIYVTLRFLQGGGTGNFLTYFIY